MNERNHIADSTHQYKIVVVFIAMLPFVYMIQVVGGHPAFGILGYLPVFLLLFILIKGWPGELAVYAKSITTLSLLLTALIGSNAISGLMALVHGNVGIAGRVIVLFVLPFMVFLAGRRLSENHHWGIVKVIAITAAIVAVELTWESVSVWILREPSWFQLTNRYYVLAHTGKDLGQLWWIEYRPPGLLEHVHATVFFLLLGAVAGTAAYVKTASNGFLIAAVLCSTVLVSHGVRFPLAVAMTSLAIMLIVMHRALNAEARPRVSRALWALLIAAGIALIADPFDTVERFYMPVLTQGIWSIERSEITATGVVITGVEGAVDVAQSRLRANLFDRDFFQGLLGHGIASSLIGNVDGLDDDFFVAQIFSQYGLLGGTMFYVIFFTALVASIYLIKDPHKNDVLLIVFATTAVAILAISTLHSGVVQRKAIFGILMWLLAVIDGRLMRVKSSHSQPKFSGVHD